MTWHVPWPLHSAFVVMFLYLSHGEQKCVLHSSLVFGFVPTAAHATSGYTTLSLPMHFTSIVLVPPLHGFVQVESA
jgi:hypothetical protein